MPGVSGEEKVSGPPMSGGFASEPGFVPSERLEGLCEVCGDQGLRDMFFLSKSRAPIRLRYDAEAWSLGLRGPQRK
jgi:hypothetical protein